MLDMLGTKESKNLRRGIAHMLEVNRTPSIPRNKMYGLGITTLTPMRCDSQGIIFIFGSLIF